MVEPWSVNLPDAAATESLGAALAAALTGGRDAPAPSSSLPSTLVIYLEGPLGAGKTTVARALLRGLGHGGRVPSPTYTLVEPYDLPACRLFHLDLYRLGSPDEVDYLGITDVLESDPTAGTGDAGNRTGILLVEWPEKGAGHLPPADLCLHLDHARLEPEGAGRTARVSAGSGRGDGLSRDLRSLLVGP